MLANDHGKFREVTREMGLDQYTGWWNGVNVGDFDGDGRVDLVVTQNSAETRLFRNVRGTPGLRVRLRGPSSNPSGVGAVVRLRSGGNFDPAYAIQAGAGYWSQDSSIVVLGHGPEPPVEVSVVWPGGRRTHVTVTNGSREITVSFE